MRVNPKIRWLVNWGYIIKPRGHLRIKKYRNWLLLLVISVADPDPGSGAFMPLIRNGFFPDLGSQTQIFDSWMTNVWVKKSTSSVLAKKNFLHRFKNNIIYNYMIFVATKNGRTTFFSPPFRRCCWIRDSGWIKIRIRDKHSESATLLVWSRSTGTSGSVVEP